MTRVTRRPLAVADILEIWDYIADDSLAAADRWVERLDELLRTLAAQPLIGLSREELAPDARSFPFGRYIVFYIPLSDGIDVVRVLHGARDIDSVFSEGEPP
ncbi:MAG: type II toxin-antitoxin system RelE/ParE family toxin [Betaproteobacteria bacterium]